MEFIMSYFVYIIFILTIIILSISRKNKKILKYYQNKHKS
jgi:hypothetical protein